uniref:Uncharacterized protein n=1 Tax=Cannabis sativa TaxID=3483 RepID=A0A803QTJ3_CANSA
MTTTTMINSTPFPTVRLMTFSTTLILPPHRLLLHPHPLPPVVYLPISTVRPPSLDTPPSLRLMGLANLRKVLNPHNWRKGELGLEPLRLGGSSSAIRPRM